MGDYYNKTRGSLPVGLKGGRSLTVPGKQWFHLDPADEGSADLQHYLATKDIVRSKVDKTQVLASSPAINKPVLTEVTPHASSVLTEDEDGDGSKERG